MGTALLESVGNRLLASFSVQCSLLKWWCLLKVKGCWNVKRVIIFSCLANILLRILYSCIFLLIKDFLIHIHFGQSKICIFFRMVEIKYKYRMDWANFWQFSYQNKHSSERTLSLSLWVNSSQIHVNSRVSSGPLVRRDAGTVQESCLVLRNLHHLTT